MMIRKVASALIALGVTTTALACELHNMPGFGVFGASMPGKIQPHAMSKSTRTLKVTHPNFLAIESDTDASIDVEYTLPLEYRNIEIAFTPSENVTLEGKPKISPTALRGTYALNFQANAVGEHEISVSVNATKQGQPYSLERKIRITAF
jgi:hypothetical protein